jgi:hypothetical protein
MFHFIRGTLYGSSKKSRQEACSEEGRQKGDQEGY